MIKSLSVVAWDTDEQTDCLLCIWWRHCLLMPPGYGLWSSIQNRDSSGPFLKRNICFARVLWAIFTCSYAPELRRRSVEFAPSQIQCQSSLRRVVTATDDSLVGWPLLYCFGSQDGIVDEDQGCTVRGYSVSLSLSCVYFFMSAVTLRWVRNKDV